jgi:hypothetical protein
LRDAIRALLRSAVDGQRPPVEALRIVNHASAAAPPALQLGWRTDGPLRQQRSSSASDPVVAAEGILLKDHSRRRWCSASCGQRIRAAR